MVVEKPLIIVGAGRQGRNILEICRSNARPVAGFLDDTKGADTVVNGAPVIGGLSFLQDSGVIDSHAWIVGIGDNGARSTISSQIAGNAGELVCVIHPSCSIAATANIGAGVYINAFTKLLPNCQVSDYCILEGPSSIGCDSFTGQACLFGPGVQLLGGARVGDGSLIGAGTIICEDRQVGARCRIGAGSIVLSDIPDDSFAFGTPAKIIAPNSR